MANRFIGSSAISSPVDYSCRRSSDANPHTAALGALNGTQTAYCRARTSYKRSTPNPGHPEAGLTLQEARRSTAIRGLSLRHLSSGRPTNDLGRKWVTGGLNWSRVARVAVGTARTGTTSARRMRGRVPLGRS